MPLADIAGLEILGYHDAAMGHLQRGEDRLYRIDRVALRPKVLMGDESKIDEALQLLERAEQVCLISRSVASPSR